MSYRDCVRFIKEADTNNPMSLIYAMRATEAIKEIESDILLMKEKHIEWMFFHARLTIFTTALVTAALVAILYFYSN